MAELAELLDVSVDDIIMATDAMRDPASLHEQLDPSMFVQMFERLY